MTKKAITVRLPPDLLDELRQVSRAEERSMNTTFQRAVRQYVERRQEKKN